MVGVFIVTVTRFTALVAHSEARKNIILFPSGCSDWTSDAGCCYITMENNCVNKDEIESNSYSIAFDSDKVSAQLLNEQIETCGRDMAQAKLQSPKKLSDETGYQDLIHVTFTSAIFGFIDDMYLETYNDSKHSVNVVNVMSQLRIGKSDFGVNTSHVLKMLKCLDSTLHASKYMPCDNYESEYADTDTIDDL